MSPLVFGSYTQDQLDAQYDQSTLVSDIASYFKKWQEGSRRARARLVVKEAIPYGSDSEEALDVFPPASPNGALHIHYHGGAWRALSSQDAWFLAEPWVERGYTFVSVNFGLVPQISLATQVEQSRRALAWCHEKASDLQADPGRIIVSGHSSGAHLAAMSALADWKVTGKKPPDVKAVILVSGIYDLLPVRLSARNNYLRLSDSEASNLSPIHHLREKLPSCVVIWSQQELQEFQRQSEEFVARLRNRCPVKYQAIDLMNHFETWNLITPDLLAQ